MGQADVRRLVEQYRVGWFDHDVDAIMAVVTADIVFHNVTAVAEWTARATAPDGRRLEWDGIDVINCRERLIARNAVYSSAHVARVL